MQISGSIAVAPDNDLLRIWNDHYQSAMTAAGFAAVALVIYSFFKKFPYNEFLQALAVCVFLAVVADVTLLEWVKLPKVACVLIGAASGFLGRPLMLSYVKKDSAVADGLVDRIPNIKKQD